MLVLVLVLAASAVAATLLGALVRQGFRHGDVPADALVSARVLAPDEAGGGAGTWVEVAVVNRAPSAALVAIGLGRRRAPVWLLGPADRRTAGPRHRLALADRVVGAVPADDSARFWLWADGGARGRRVLVSVGTPGRLRLHRIALDAAGRVDVAAVADAQRAVLS